MTTRLNIKIMDNRRDDILHSLRVPLKAAHQLNIVVTLIRSQSIIVVGRAIGL